MKKIIKKPLIGLSLITITSLLLACGNNPPENKNAKTDPPPQSMIAQPSAAEVKAEKGKEVYTRVCLACHQADGKGVEGAFPPLASSDFFATDKLKMVANIVHGIKGPITVNGKKYNTEMPKQALADDEVAAVATYVLNNFGNKGGEVSVEEVAKVRATK